MNIYDILDRVIDNCRDPYAIAYAKAAKAMPEGDDMIHQLLYVLSNTQYWRGAGPKMVKQMIRDYIKENK